MNEADEDIWSRDEDEQFDLTKKKIDTSIKKLEKEIEFYTMSHK